MIKSVEEGRLFADLAALGRPFVGGSGSDFTEGADGDEIGRCPLNLRRNFMKDTVPLKFTPI